MVISGKNYNISARCRRGAILPKGFMKQFFSMLALSAATATAAPLPPEHAAALDRISASSLRGHLMFLASDLLEGRGTPSRGQDLAAAYLAAQYQRAGLEPLGDDGYFQTAHWHYSQADLSGFALTLTAGATRLSLTPKLVTFTPGAALDARGVALIKADWNNLAALEAMGDAVNGKVVVVEPASMQPKTAEDYAFMMGARNATYARLARLKPLFVLALDRARPAGNAGGRGAVSDPATRRPQGMRTITMHGTDAARLYDALPAGATLDVRVAAASVKPIKLRNVAALLRGSDPVLKETYVVLSAHYDHLGIRADMPGDAIFNGANDNASGTVSVIEVAQALAAMTTRPKRSIVFLNVFGEELGMLGSTYYGRNPLVPLAKTVANLNLEQVGRTDGPEGVMKAKAALTGFDFTTMPAALVKAGKASGVEIYKDARYSDQYFAQSDNLAFAAVGVPAHTLSVLYQYAEYHGAGDHWPAIDYDNMAMINRTVALGLLTLANDATAPSWNGSNEKTAPYLKAQRLLIK